MILGINFNSTTLIITIFILLQTTFFYMKIVADRKMKIITQKLFQGDKDNSNNNYNSIVSSINSVLNDKKIIDILSIFEKSIKVITTPFEIISDISIFLFINILCISSKLNN